MAMALVRSTTNQYTNVQQHSVNFPTAVPSGRLLLVYAMGIGGGTTTPSPPAGWTTVFTLPVYEGDKSIGVLFAKISDGGADTGGVDGAVGPFDPTVQVQGSEWSGCTAATVRDSSVDTPTVIHTGTSHLSKAVTPPSGGLAVMVAQSQNFNGGGQIMAAEIGTQLTVSQTDQMAMLAYTLGGGSTTLQIGDNNNSDRWSDFAAAAFGDLPPAGLSRLLLGGRL